MRLIFRGLVICRRTSVHQWENEFLSEDYYSVNVVYDAVGPVVVTVCERQWRSLEEALMCISGLRQAVDDDVTDLQALT